MGNIRENFRIKKYEFSHYLKAILNHFNDQEKKFIIFAHWRTGSTLLSRLLDSHPDISCDREIFHCITRHPDIKSTIFFPNLFIKGNAVKHSTKVYGFDLKLYQMNKFLRKPLTPNEFIYDLFNNGWKIIHLRRKNILRQAISNYVAHKKKQWHHWTHSKIDHTKVNVNFNELSSALQSLETNNIEEKNILENIEYISIVYEENLLHSVDHQSTCNKIFEFLELESKPVSTDIKKLSPNRLEDSIENYDEFLHKLSKTNYIKYISEE